MVKVTRQLIFANIEVNTDQQWQNMLQREGITVVEIYTEWCGPCTAMEPSISKLKRELEGKNLHFAVAKSDNIETLANFKDKCEPIWMILADGKLVNILVGPNAPKLVKMITDEVNRDAAVKKGFKERNEIEFPNLPDEVEEIAEEPEEEEEKPLPEIVEYDYYPFKRSLS